MSDPLSCLGDCGRTTRHCLPLAAEAIEATGMCPECLTTDVYTWLGRIRGEIRDLALDMEPAIARGLLPAACEKQIADLLAASDTKDPL